MEELGALGDIIFIRARRMGQNTNFDGAARILIHTLELKLWHFKVFSYVCTGKPCVCNVLSPGVHYLENR